MDIASFISSIIIEKLKVSLGRIASEFGDEISHILNNHILEYQIEEYRRCYKTKTLLHRVEPKKLLDFYQPLHIRKYLLRESEQKHLYSVSTDLVRNLFLSHPYITLIGHAGSGKTTITKYLFLNAYDTKFKIPIKVELRYLNDYTGSLLSFIKEKVFKTHKIANNDKVIDRLLNSGQFIFFLDGYDEISVSKKSQLTKDIDELVSVYFRNYYLITSRPYTDIDLLPMFENFVVCNLSDNDITEFIKKQIPNEENELIKKIHDAINDQENIIYKNYLSNPLLLSMFILTFQSYSIIPQKRSEFFSQVFDTLFSLHDSMSKLAFVREKQCGLSKEQFIEVLKIFSFLSYFEDKFIFNESYLYGKFSIVKEKKNNLEFDNDNLIKDLQVAIGIFIKDGLDYSFPHRSLQEYFAAIHIANIKNKGNKKIIYFKLFAQLLVPDNYRISLRDNFFTLLEELDTEAIVEYGIIPLLTKFKNVNYQLVADTDLHICFNSLVQLYGLFYTTIQSNDFFTYTSDLKILELKYREEEADFLQFDDTIFSNLQEKYDFLERKVKDKIAIEIRKILIDYKIIFQLKVDELNIFLRDESQSEQDIVALI